MDYVVTRFVPMKALFRLLQVLGAILLLAALIWFLENVCVMGCY